MIGHPLKLRRQNGLPNAGFSSLYGVGSPLH